jgi:hypothetical protein
MRYTQKQILVVHHCNILTENKICSHILVEVPNIKFCENPFNSSVLVICGQTNMGKLISTFWQVFIANLSKRIILRSVH